LGSVGGSSGFVLAGWLMLQKMPVSTLIWPALLIVLPLILILGPVILTSRRYLGLARRIL
jgi:hypothetical protein